LNIDQHTLCDFNCTGNGLLVALLIIMTYPVPK
jgi:hypothetical protein